MHELKTVNQALAVLRELAQSHCRLSENEYNAAITLLQGMRFDTHKENASREARVASFRAPRVDADDEKGPFGRECRSKQGSEPTTTFQAIHMGNSTFAIMFNTIEPVLLKEPELIFEWTTSIENRIEQYSKTLHNTGGWEEGAVLFSIDTVVPILMDVKHPNANHRTRLIGQVFINPDV